MTQALPQPQLPPAQVVIQGQGARPTLYLKQNLRSGRVVRYDGHLVVLGDVHAGCELTVTGDIVIWGDLRGIAHAGAPKAAVVTPPEGEAPPAEPQDMGDPTAEIRALRLEAIQLRVGPHIARRPDRRYGHRPNAEPSPVGLSPEVARVVDGEIQVFADVAS